MRFVTVEGKHMFNKRLTAALAPDGSGKRTKKEPRI